MKYENIEINYKNMLGKPTIKGTRITVEQILRLLAEGATNQEILESFPNLKQEDISACISYSADLIKMDEPIAV